MCKHVFCVYRVAFADFELETVAYLSRTISSVPSSLDHNWSDTIMGGWSFLAQYWHWLESMMKSYWYGCIISAPLLEVWRPCTLTLSAHLTETLKLICYSLTVVYPSSLLIGCGFFFQSSRNFWTMLLHLILSYHNPCMSTHRSDH